MIHAVRTLHQVAGPIQSVTDGAPVAGIEHRGLSSTAGLRAGQSHLPRGVRPTDWSDEVMTRADRTLHQVAGPIQSVADGAPVAGIEHHGLSSSSSRSKRGD